MASRNGCFDFARGKCSRGIRCRFSHDANLPCPFQAKFGRCAQLDRCPFVHSSGGRASDHDTMAHPRPSTAFRAEADLEASCRQWTYMIPRQDSQPQRRAPISNLQIFFETGWDLVDRGDAEIRQYVIKKLASENGLAMVKSLADLMVDTTTDIITLSVFRTRTLPFFKTISYPEIMSSLVLEAPVDTIFSFLFGLGGRRAVQIFRAVTTAITALVGRDSSNQNLQITAMISSLSVLQRLIDAYSTAQVVEDFRPVVETLSACLADDAALLPAKQSIERIRRRLNLGDSLPLRAQTQQPIAVQDVTFELDVDLPGQLSKVGPRHDNDHQNISNIKILPTTAEIMSHRQEYLPSRKNSVQHLSGIAGLLDKHFRLLREDTVGQVRDAVNIELNRLEHPNQATIANQSGKKVLRNVVHRHLQLLRLVPDKRKGLQILVGFDQPEVIRQKGQKAREEWWQNSKRLQTDSFVCLVTASQKVIFFSVSDLAMPSARDQRAPADADVVTNEPIDGSQNTPSLFKDIDQATVLLTLVEYNAEDVSWLVAHLGSRHRSRQSLVEFPGLLLAAFQPTLKALQRMNRTLEVPFSDIIAPHDDLSMLQAQNQPPAYARQVGFRFNLDCLSSGHTLSLKPGSDEAFDFETFNEHTILDEAQQEAVIHALKTALAAIQGPPGTGKSYTGVSVIKALLNNRAAAKLGPIICVCYTNHALDQLLEHLWQDGVRQIIRLGSRSKSEVLQKLNLHVVSKDVVPTKQEKHDKWQYNQLIHALMSDLRTILYDLNDQSSWRNVRDYLQLRQPHRFRELFKGRVDEDGFVEVKQGRKIQIVDSWLKQAPKRFTENRSVELLDSIPLNSMSSLERSTMHKHWLKLRSDELSQGLIGILDELYEARSNLDKCHREVDLRCLRQANIIGVTTSGLAKTIDVLGRVGAKVVICEEAGEVLEAHTLTTFLPGIEHAILIGDHEQLRPQINNYDLQHDDPRGQKFSLDISLFERLVNPEQGQMAIPCVTLQTQRRMHPSISELIRVPLYPNLKDHTSVLTHPEVKGMRKRLYWLDHREKEDPRPAQSVSMSRTNAFEVDMVEALVAHLIRQGTYGNEDIAVLTPYLGQLIKIRKRLASNFSIVVGDRDIEDLEAKGFEDAEDQQQQAQKSTLLSALRIATVDNFQGEEAKVVILSLVRSNEERKCGFLRTSNRINVLLSRARDGMYIIGNSDTAGSVLMWSQVISLLKKSDNIGKSLALCCSKHLDTPIEVSTVDDFATLSPEGGCNLRCSSRLRCGHACPNMCHSDALHNAVRCLERCQRVKRNCDHACPRPCGDRCEDKCQVWVKGIPLPCGHVADRLRCFQAQAPETVQCLVRMKRIMPHCKHMMKVACHQLPLDVDHPCPAKCGALLPCGHACNSQCRDCMPRMEGRVPHINHPQCTVPCGRPYSTCGHSCQTPCHNDTPCPLCDQPCQVSCSHSKCSRRCHEPCVPCAEDCDWCCPHHGKCSLPCAVPCNLLPCSKRCTSLLSCGHQCPSLCGEICPDGRFCQSCANESIKTMVVDYIMSSTYEEIILDESPCIIPSCGHILTLESMDGHMSMSDFYISDANGSITGLATGSEPFSASSFKSCPQCRGPLRNINRYSRIVRRALIDESTKKFIVWANAGFGPLVSRMENLEAFLRDNAQDSLVAALGSTQSLDLIGSRDMQFTRIGLLVQGIEEYQPLLYLRRDIKHFLKQVDETEQPFGRVRDLVIDASRHRGLDVDESIVSSDTNILQTRNRLLTTVLLIRCDYAILVSLLESYKNACLGLTTNRIIKINFNENRRYCEVLMIEAREKHQPGVEVEGHLYWARFLGLERSISESTDKFVSLRDTAREHLEEARQICTTHPGQTKGMLDEISETEKMLRDSTFYMPVTNEEMKAVYAAMARSFTGTGHWYYCVNGHPFTIGECGMPMQTSVCPQCGEQVGGTNHAPLSGVSAATDLEREFGGLALR